MGARHDNAILQMRLTFKRRLSDFATSKFLRNVVKLVGGTIIGQGVTLAALPILTRIYSPEEYGFAGLFAAIVLCVTAVSTLRYEYAIPIPSRPRGARQVTAAALIAAAAVTTITGVGAVLTVLVLPHFVGLSEWQFVGLLVLAVTAISLFNVGRAWATRKQEFGRLAAARIQQGVAGVGVQIGLGFAGFGVAGLILGQIASQSAGAARLLRLMPTPLLDGVAWAARRYRNFPLYDTWSGLLNVGSAQAPVILFAALFSPVLVGYYAFATRIVAAPISLVGQAAARVFLPHIIEENRSGSGAAAVLKLTSALAYIGFPAFTLLAVLASPLVRILFGEEWVPASMIVSWTALWAGWQLVASPLSVTLIGLEAQKTNTLLQAALFTLRCLAILIGYWQESEKIAIMLFSFASILVYLAFILAVGRLVGIGYFRMIRPLVVPLFVSAVLFGSVQALWPYP